MVLAVHLRPVAHPAQQPVGDAGRAAGAQRDLAHGVLVGVDAEQPGRAVQDRHEVGGGVVVEVAGEAEAVAQRRRQQPRAGGGPDDGEGRQLERDRGRARPLADDDVDPEVLHREVEHLLGRARHAVDLVEEEDLALGERREHRRRGRPRAGWRAPT